MLVTPKGARGQDSEPVSAPAAATVPEGSDRTDDASAQLAKQAAEMASMKAEFERQLAEERSARQAAEANTNAAITAAVAAELQKAPKVSGLDGLTLSGFIQADMYAKQSSEDQLNTSSGAPLNDDRFSIRRMRLRTSIERRYLAAIAELDANTTNGSQVRPMNVEVTAKIPGEKVPYIAATVGIFKIPYGYEIGQSDYLRLFAERSNLERAMFPGEYDLGARVAGGWRFVRYALAVQNGEPLGESTFPARDANAAKDVVGRVGVTSPLGGGVDVQGGFSALAGRGLHKGTPPTKPTVTWQDRNENGRIDANELIASPGSSGLPSLGFPRYAVGADLLLNLTTPWLGTTTLYGEITWAKNLDRAMLIADPYGPLGRDLREMGYYVAVVQDFGRYVQGGVRYDFYDPDRDSTDRVAATVLLSSQAISTVALALAARLRLGGLTNRVLVQYDINRNHAGRDASGLPTNLANNVFTLRAEAVF